MSYPDKFIKGIPNETFLDEEKNPASHLFHFELRQDVPIRADKNIESSINWYDHRNALEIILRKEKEPGKIQFKEGAVILSRHELDRIKMLAFIQNRLSYERRPIKGNDYHGNLLLHETVPKKVMHKIAATIATLCVEGVEKL